MTGVRSVPVFDWHTPRFARIEGLCDAARVCSTSVLAFCECVFFLVKQFCELCRNSRDASLLYSWSLPACISPSARPLARAALFWHGTILLDNNPQMLLQTHRADLQHSEACITSLVLLTLWASGPKQQENISYKCSSLSCRSVRDLASGKQKRSEKALGLVVLLWHCYFSTTYISWITFKKKICTFSYLFLKWLFNLIFSHFST